MKIDQNKTIKSVLNPINDTHIPLSQAVHMGLVSKDLKTYYNPQTDERMPIEEAIERGFVIPRDASQTEESVEGYPKPGKPRAIIDWENGVIRHSITGEKMSIDAARSDGLIDKTTADLLKKKMKDTSASNEEADTVSITIQMTTNVSSSIDAITITEDQSMEAEDEGSREVKEGIFSLEAAVKLGIYDVRTGQFRDPLNGETMSLQEAVDRGLIDLQAPAIVDIKTGRTLSLEVAF
jgi:hypothetical protein